MTAEVCPPFLPLPLRERAGVRGRHACTRSPVSRPRRHAHRNGSQILRFAQNDRVGWVNDNLRLFTVKWPSLRMTEGGQLTEGENDRKMRE